MILTAGTIIAASAVALGAFGAHGLESALPTWYDNPDLVAQRLDNWETGVRYQMYHGLGLILLGLIPTTALKRQRLAAMTMGIGSLVFSGCLYLLVLSNLSWLGAVVPIGGLLQLAGWGLMASCCWARQAT